MRINEKFCLLFFYPKEEGKEEMCNMKKESYEKLEMEVIAFDKIHMDTTSTSGIAGDGSEDTDEGIWTGYY